MTTAISKIRQIFFVTRERGICFFNSYCKAIQFRGYYFSHFVDGMSVRVD